MKRLILLISALTCVFSVQSQSCDVFPLAQNITYNSVEITWASSNAQNYQYQYKLLGSVVGHLNLVLQLMLALLETQIQYCQ